MNNQIRDYIDNIVHSLAQMPEAERITVLNEIRSRLHEVSPFKNEPVDCVLWVPGDTVQANNYNPNSVAPPEMKLLEISIATDGFTQPIVVVKEKLDDREHTVADGFHRNRVGKESSRVKLRIKGYLPITVIGDEHMPMADRMASTIRHNRARGSHNIDLMSNIVAELVEMGKSDGWIAKHLGMDADEVLRLKQITGLAALFKDRKYSRSWV
ncbi:MAG: ParB/RepB/Spo0J family partition protein [Desulfosporosinus sp.]